MHSPRFALVLAFLCGIAVACGGTSSSSPIGASCTSAAACGGGVCAVSKDFPSGYCTEGCTVSIPSSCPSGSVCIDDASGVPEDAGVSAICYLACASNAECPSGYACLEKANHMVCRHSG